MARCVSSSDKIRHFCTYCLRRHSVLTKTSPPVARAQGGRPEYRACFHQVLGPQVGRRRPFQAVSTGSLSAQWRTRALAQCARMRVVTFWGARYLGNGFELCE
eukprot:200737-Prymnesium_polylepis.1